MDATQIAEQISSLEKLFNQLNSQLQFNIQLFWAILIGVLAVGATAIGFIMKSAVQNAVTKGVDLAKKELDIYAELNQKILETNNMLTAYQGNIASEINRVNSSLIQKVDKNCFDWYNLPLVGNYTGIIRCTAIEKLILVSGEVKTSPHSQNSSGMGSNRMAILPVGFRPPAKVITITSDPDSVTDLAHVSILPNGDILGQNISLKGDTLSISFSIFFYIK